jgi:integrase
LAQVAFALQSHCRRVGAPLGCAMREIATSSISTGVDDDVARRLRSLHHVGEFAAHWPAPCLGAAPARRHLSLMKIDFFVSDLMMPAIPSQTGTLANPALANPALNMELQKAQLFADAALSSGTRRVYASAWRRFEAWCAVTRIDPLAAPENAIGAYLATLARGGKSISGVTIALSAILCKRRRAGEAIDARHPDIAAVVSGVRRRTAKPVSQAAPLGLDDLARLATSLHGGDLRARRDRALLLVGFFGALRRSEIAALDINGRSPIAITEAGLVLSLTATKGNAATAAIMLPRRPDALCPVAAIEAYLKASGATSGPLFRAISKSGRLLARRLDATSVRHILHSRLAILATRDGATILATAKRTGAKRTDAKRLSPHSLRAGFITAAAQAGAPEYLIQRTSRHKAVDVLRSYIRSADGFTENAANFIR